MPSIRNKRNTVPSQEENDLDESKPVFIQNQKEVCNGCGCKPRKFHNATECEIIQTSVNILVRKQILKKQHEIIVPVKAMRNVKWPVEYTMKKQKTFKPHDSFELSFKKEGVTKANVKNSQQLRILFDSIVNVLGASAKRWSLFPELGGLMHIATASYPNSVNIQEQTMEDLNNCLRKFVKEAVLGSDESNKYSMIPSKRDFKAALEVKKLGVKYREDGLPGIILLQGKFIPSVKLSEWNVNSAQEYFNNSERMISYFEISQNSAFIVENKEM